MMRSSTLLKTKTIFDNESKQEQSKTNEIEFTKEVLNKLNDYFKNKESNEKNKKTIKTILNEEQRIKLKNILIENNLEDITNNDNYFYKKYDEIRSKLQKNISKLYFNEKNGYTMEIPQNQIKKEKVEIKFKPKRKTFKESSNLNALKKIAHDQYKVMI